MKEYPFLKAKKRGVKPDALLQYVAEAEQMGESGFHQILDRGKDWRKELSTTLAESGAIVFPHTYLSKCGYQIAAAVHACLDCGTERVLALGVFHPSVEELWEARQKELNGEDISYEPSWGILGPGLNRYEGWKNEFSLNFFKLLMQIEAKRRNINPPILIERYPSLCNRRPENLPGIEELVTLAKECPIVVSDDLCHHGVAYGVEQSDAHLLDDEGLLFAKTKIEAGYRLLEKGDYAAYYQHWIDPEAIGDPTDASCVMRYLLGAIQVKVLDCKLVDVSPLFTGDPEPSWVATTLAAIHRLDEIHLFKNNIAEADEMNVEKRPCS